ncbi:ATP-binding protein [Nocardioides sp. GXQ0305]|uniref:ATP-binding protein n=1 Tax=Nocardioides sp. GXQ0305 TaxID=3423912 RepID=UPI003D7C7C7A
MPSVPHSVQQARRWVIDAIEDIGRPELVDTAELGVSELVTNAVLHATDPISVRVRGTQEHPRVEVRDGSTEPPVMPADLTASLPPDEGELLLTFGRGLDIVARCADAWGAEIEDSGKVMWFAPAATPRDEGVPGSVTGLPEPPARATRDTVLVKLLGAPIRALAEFEAHYRELRREVRLLALAHEDKYPIAKSLADLFGSLQREVQEGLDAEQLRKARQDGQEAVDLVVPVSPAQAETMGRFVELLDFADDFCRQQQLLALARTPPQVLFQTWFFTEFERQGSGRSARPWEAVASSV